MARLGRNARPRLAPLAAMLAVIMVSACAQVPKDPVDRAEFYKLNDPLEPMNRVVFKGNMTLDKYVMKPVAVAYNDTVPSDVRDSVHNFLDNLSSPYILANDLLQGRFHNAAATLGRFMLNSTYGVLGLVDVTADSGGPKYHDADFGETLGVWGIPQGPYLVLPFFGPSNPRDAVGIAVDWFADPTDNVLNIYSTAAVDARTGADILDERARMVGPLDDVQRNSIDFYAAIRSLYRQNRRSMINPSHLPSLDGQ
jgi:phospholipid-binding lipoprotein MlaA